MFLGGFEAMATAAQKNVHKKIWDVVRNMHIPEGCVTSYGWVAKKADLDLKKRGAQIVGTAMKEAAACGEPIPWRRVIRNSGCISANAPDEQSTQLKNEGWKLRKNK